MEEFPLGFRFYPTEEELVLFYLRNKLEEKNRNIDHVIPLLDIYQLDPWQLPKHCGERCRGDTEQWFFFMPRQQNEARGGRPSRTTASGYWKATGSPSYVYSSGNKVIGIKKSMVFYKGKAPTGRKTKWKMNEYRAIEEEPNTSTRMLRHELSLCRVYVVSGTFRAFDKRPIHVTKGSSSRNLEIGQETDKLNLSATKQDNETTPIMQKSCSSESSFSGGNCDVGNAVLGGSTSSEMIDDDFENLIKWEDI